MYMYLYEFHNQLQVHINEKIQGCPQILIFELKTNIGEKITSCLLIITECFGFFLLE